MTKYLLTTEFRYNVIPKAEYHTDCKSKTITHGIFDNIDDVINEGNNVLKQLKASGKFTICDRFERYHLFGNPTDLVTNCCSHDKVEFYTRITYLHFDDINDVVNDVFASQDAYDNWGGFPDD